MRAYRDLFHLPGTKLTAIASFVARLPFGMTPLALVLLVEGTLGSYAAAGLVSGAHAVGIGLIGPVQGRLVDRFGQTRVLVPFAVAYAALLSLLIVSIRPGPATVPVILALVAGMAFPPIAPCSRVAWASYLRGSPLRETAYALDAVIVELSFVFGPLVVAAVLAFSTPAAAVAGAGVLAMVGTLAFAASLPSRTAVDTSERVRGRGALRSRGVRSVVLTFLVMSIAFGVVEVAIPAFAEDLGSAERAGVLLSMLAAGSLVGALVFGSRQWPGTAADRYAVLLTAFGAGLVLVPLAFNLISMGAAMFVAGVALAPTVICAYLLIEAAAPAGAVTESFSWTTTANVIGAAAGAAAAGVVADAAGARPALAIGTGAVLAAALLAWLSRSAVAPPG